MTEKVTCNHAEYPFYQTPQHPVVCSGCGKPLTITQFKIALQNNLAQVIDEINGVDHT